MAASFRKCYRGACECLVRAQNAPSEMARVTGLEPATSGVTGRRSNQLSYTRNGNARGPWDKGRASGCQPRDVTNSTI